MVGWPLVLGPISQDGDTVVEVWDETPIDDLTYIVGGYSTSKDFTETERNKCDQGCAFLTVWTSNEERFWARWVISNVNSVVGIVSESLQNNSVVLYNKAKDDKNNYYIGFVKYSINQINKNIIPELVKEVYEMKHEFDFKNLNELNNLLYLRNNRIYLV